jgi:hypothetical protein
LLGIRGRLGIDGNIMPYCTLHQTSLIPVDANQPVPSPDTTTSNHI